MDKDNPRHPAIASPRNVLRTFGGSGPPFGFLFGTLSAAYNTDLATHDKTNIHQQCGNNVAATGSRSLTEHRVSTRWNAWLRRTRSQQRTGECFFPTTPVPKVGGNKKYNGGGGVSRCMAHTSHLQPQGTQNISTGGPAVSSQTAQTVPKPLLSEVRAHGWEGRLGSGGASKYYVGGKCSQTSRWH